MKYLSLLFLLCLLSCGNEKTVQLPELTHSEINEIKDVSAAYLFYNETQPDSVELNRKNLISTTNWLINVDKRLTLEQAIPKITFLQDKKRNAEVHKNEAAKNYYTCNNTSIKNLGFLEFTDVVYHTNKTDFILNNEEPTDFSYIMVLNLNTINVVSSDNKIINTSLKTLPNIIKDSIQNTGLKTTLILGFEKQLSFQDYITFKSLVSDLKSETLIIDTNEYIY